MSVHKIKTAKQRAIIARLAELARMKKEGELNIPPSTDKDDDHPSYNNVKL